jgi:hypothetical protein
MIDYQALEWQYSGQDPFWRQYGRGRLGRESMMQAIASFKQTLQGDAALANTQREDQRQQYRG